MRQAPDLIEALVKIYPIIKCLFKTLQLFAYEYEWPPNRHRCNGDWHSKITSINLELIICRYICLEIKCSGNIQCSKWRSCVSMMYYLFSYLPNSFQFSSVTQLRLTLCNPMDGSTPGLPIHHQLPETQTHVHRVGDAIQPSHPLSSPSPLDFSLSQHQGYYLIIFIGEILKRPWALKLALYPTHKISLTNTAVLEKLSKPFEITMLLFNNPENCFGASPCGSAGKESTCNAGDLGSIPGLERIFVRLWTPIPMCVGCSHIYQVILGHRLDVLQLNSILTLPGDTVRSTG